MLLGSLPFSPPLLIFSHRSPCGLHRPQHPFIINISQNLVINILYIFSLYCLTWNYVQYLLAILIFRILVLCLVRNSDILILGGQLYYIKQLCRIFGWRVQQLFEIRFQGRTKSFLLDEAQRFWVIFQKCKFSKENFYFSRTVWVDYRPHPIFVDECRGKVWIFSKIFKNFKQILLWQLIYNASKRGFCRIIWKIF